MLLSDRDIRHAQETGTITITPFDTTLLQPASLDVRLSNQFRIFNTNGCIDPNQPQDNMTKLVHVEDLTPFTLYPNQFALASTHEHVCLGGSVAARYEGKSSLGRLGLLTHVTAGFIDPGFEGTVTLELANVSGRPIKLWPGMRIGQLCFFRMSSVPDRLYGRDGVGSHYQHQDGPTPSRAGQ